MEKVYSRGEILIREGEQDKALYMLKSGKLGVLKNGRLVAEITDPGVLFGEMSILLDQPRSATVKALTPCVVEVYEVDIDTLPESDPQVTRVILRALAKRLADTTTKLHLCMLAEDEHRTAVSGPSGISFEDLTVIDDGIIERVIELATNDDLVAALMGTTPRVRGKFFGNMSRGKAEAIREDMLIAVDFLTRSAVGAAKMRILKEIAALEESEPGSTEDAEEEKPRRWFRKGKPKGKG